MLEDKKNRQSVKSQSGVGRREFIGAALGGAAVAGGLLSSAETVSAAEKTATGVYREEIRTPIVARYQVVVAGGGPGGFIAALAAARSGARTLLIERYSFLGGNGTAGLMTCYNGFRNQRPPEALQTVKGIPAEYIAEIVRLGGVADADSYAREFQHDVANGDIPYCVGFDPEAAKVATLNLVKKEGVELRLHSWVVGPMLDGSRVTGVIMESKSGRQAITADIVIDATGDGDIAARAGAPFMSPAQKGDRMNMSLMYRIGGLPSSIKGSYGGIRIGDRVVKWGPRFGGDGLDVENLTRAEVETRLELWDRVQTMRKKPGMESVYLMQTAMGIGVRETRRILGEYVVTEQDAIKCRRFDDVIAISSNPMPSYHGKRFFFNHEGFDIPYRSLVPKKVEGLVLTGRCISSEQAPFQSARSMAPAMAIGHASGCAAAMAAKENVPPRKLNVKALQKLLLSQNAELRMQQHVG
ncbi:MAG: FAD-dependent oxidoreductase [Phycisphaerales bacterium]|nr:MAG: FAD-dependent oxidoreductase [Phycisphaerales bacterium]